MNVPAVIELPFRTEPDGTIRIGSTRVTLDVVIEFYRSGLTADDIAAELDVLNPADVHLVIGYYLAHRAEVDAYLAKRDTEAGEIRRKLEGLPGYRERMDEILARLKSQRKPDGGR